MIWVQLGSNSCQIGAKPRTRTQNKTKRTNKIDFVSSLCKQGGREFESPHVHQIIRTLSASVFSPPTRRPEKEGLKVLGGELREARPPSLQQNKKGKALSLPLVLAARCARRKEVRR